MIDEAPLSNGQMGDMWVAAWCDRCEWEHTWSHTERSGGEGADPCSILSALMLGVFPIEELTETTLAGPWNPRTHLTCASFRPCRPCAGEEIPPGPIPGQLDIFGGEA